ncbi:MAG: SH3 domain-containing protein [Clostridiaceae bacterium]|jgi:cell wall-associated NlpC family hydrolase|nr:SH3 domain-containing protein [Clostridia bacterium]MBP6161573.1 SH3 domain-containing protein [Clostridia bacterium]MBP6949464.1 SH3 domain-containing protein [Clostridia bacterium]NMA35348.1 SH3 domain-containing protein [Clostridiaceae bacterium]
MSESHSEKVSSPDDTTQDHFLRSRRGRPQVRRKQRFGKSSIGRYLFYGLPIVVFVLIVSIFVVSIATVKHVEVPFQDFRDGENQQGGQIDRGASPDLNATEKNATVESYTLDTTPRTGATFTQSTPSTVEFTLPTKPYPHIVLVTPDESGSSEASPSTTDTGMPVKGSTQYVLNHQVYVREGPGKEYPIAGFGLRGMSLRVLEPGEEWSMIRTENSLEGYMLNELFGPVQPDNVVEEIGMGRYMYIDTDAANLREGPTTDSERISVAYRDEKVYQIATNGGWSRIKTEGGITAYIRNDLIRETPPVDPFVKTNRAIYVNTGVANVRELATTDSAIIGQVRLDERLTELETNGTWSKVKLRDGTIGYVYGELLTTLEPAPSGFKKASGTVYVNTGYANIRSKPNTNSSILTVLRFGTSLKKIAVGTGWTFIEYSEGKRGYISSDLIINTKPTSSGTNEPSPTTPTNDKNAARRKQVVEVARSLLGTPYIRGGATTRGVDCSGLVKYAYSAVGYNMFHGATGQAQYYGTKVSFSGRDFSPLLLGDLIFFSKGTGYHHVGIYVGNDQMIHATSRNGVHIVNLMKYSETPALVKRVLPLD